MKSHIALIFFLSLFTSLAWAQYYPRGVNLNDGYLPNLDEPDKWMVGLEGMFDFQREKTGTGQASFQTTRANFNVLYGGQIFRGGLQVLHDVNRDVKDLSVGFALAYNRPLFIEVGAGYLNRLTDQTSTEGWSYNAKLGYYFNWIMDIKYRVRIRLSVIYNFKKVNDNGDPTVTNIYPLIGLEFET